MGIVDAIKNLLKGLGITGKHLGRHAITIQYPEERWTMPERSRGMVVLLSDKETGQLNCTACELCMRACPTGAIQMESHRDEKKKKHLDEFYVDVGICCLCGLCEESCNFCAIKLCTKYEYSVLDKDTLHWDKGKLQEMGRDVDYVDTRKKKKPAAQKPTAKTASKAAPSSDDSKATGEDKPKPDSDKPETAKQPDSESPPEKTTASDAPSKTGPESDTVAPDKDAGVRMAGSPEASDKRRPDSPAGGESADSGPEAADEVKHEEERKDADDQTKEGTS